MLAVGQTPGICVSKTALQAILTRNLLLSSTRTTDRFRTDGVCAPRGEDLLA